MSVAQAPSIQLGEVLHLSDRAIPSANLQEINLAGVYSFGRGLFKRGPMRPAETSYKSYNRLVAEDFVISQPKAWEGALARVTQEFDGWFLSPVFPTFTAETERLLPGYLEWFCKRKAVWQDLQILSKGMGARRETVSPEQFLTLEIPLPSLNEQRRIVAHIDGLASKVEESNALRLSSQQELFALSISHSRKLFEALPGPRVPIESVCSAIIDNLHSNPVYAEGGTIPCIRSSDVGFGTLDLSNARRTDETEYTRRTVRGEPQTNDIVLVREGGGTGKCALVLPKHRFSLGQRVMMLRPDQRQVLPKYFLYQLLSPTIQEDYIQPLSTGSASPHLNIGALRQFPFVLPSLRDQACIVADLDALQAKVRAVNALQSETATELDAMLPAILDKAFKGEL
jgi:type I restriction enzyme, S subunit